MRLPLLLSLMPSLAAATALAQPRPDSTGMSCRQAAGLVQARGALVLGTGRHTYDRFVRDRSFCEITEVAEPGFAPTSTTLIASSATLAGSGAGAFCGTTTDVVQASPTMTVTRPVPAQAWHGAPARRPEPWQAGQICSPVCGAPGRDSSPGRRESRLGAV
jgi:hypothetical protein